MCHLEWHRVRIGQFASSLNSKLACRYVDMIVTEGVRAALRTRAQVSVCMRRVLDEQGFIEVETPMLEASAGGADARPFVTWHNALQRPYVLRIATYASCSLFEVNARGGHHSNSMEKLIGVGRLICKVLAIQLAVVFRQTHLCFHVCCGGSCSALKQVLCRVCQDSS